MLHCIDGGQPSCHMESASTILSYMEAGEVEVIVRVAEPASAMDDGESVSAFLRGLPPGTRSKADIDRQIREERESWD